MDYNDKNQLLVCNGQGLQIIGIGFTCIHCFAKHSFFLKNVLIVPHIAKKLTNISKLIQHNAITVEFQSNSCLIKDKKLRVAIFKGVLDGGLYKLEAPIGLQGSESIFSNSIMLSSMPIQVCNKFVLCDFQNSMNPNCVLSRVVFESISESHVEIDVVSEVNIKACTVTQKLGIDFDVLYQRLGHM